MKLILVGESGSGKDTIADYIHKNYNLHLIKSHTTRPRRDGEGNTYIFSNHEYYHNADISGDIFESTNFGNHFYWTELGDFLYDNWIIIVDPVGVYNLIKEFPDAKVVYVKTDVSTRCERVGLERIARDKNSFKCFPCNFIIDNNGAFNETCNYISYMMGCIYGNNFS